MDHYLYFNGEVMVEVGSEEMSMVMPTFMRSLSMQNITNKMEQRYAHTELRFFTEQMKKDYKEERVALEDLLENEELPDDEIADGDSDLKLEAAMYNRDIEMVKALMQERVYAAHSQALGVHAAHGLVHAALGVEALGVHAAHGLVHAALGVEALGVQALGVEAFGVEALGVEALGVQALRVHAAHCSTRLHVNDMYATHCSTGVHATEQTVYAAVNAAVNARMLDVNYIETHWTPIALALHYNNWSALDFILQMGGNPNMISFGRSLLFTACLDNSFDDVEMLVRYGANTDRKEFGRTMIEHATRLGYMDIVTYLKNIKWIKRRRAWATVFSTIKNVDSDDKIFRVMQNRDLAGVIASYL
jgi:hypothetical protein